MQQGAVAWFEEVDPLDGAAIHLTWFGHTVERPNSGGEVIQRGQMGDIAPVAGKQNFPQVDQAVDGLLDRCEFPGGWPLAVFQPRLRRGRPFAVVLAEGHVVGRGLDTQHDSALVVHLDRAFAEAVLDAGPFDTGGEP
jgi:hypothetical protein